MGELTAIPDKFVDTARADTDGKEVSVVKMEFHLDRVIDFRHYKYLTDT